LGLFYWLLSFFAADFDDEDSAADERAAALALRIFGTVILVWTITNIVAATHHLRGERWARVVLVASFGIVAVLGLAAGIAFFPGGLILGLPHLAAGVAVVVIAVRAEGATPTLR
jgi:hypothetical protein